MTKALLKKYVDRHLPRVGGLFPLKRTYERETRNGHQILKKMRNPSMGFSLIELMVSLTIFSIVMTISLGTLLTLIDANTKAQALSSSMTNISFALDSISRNLRTGKGFYCANTIATSGVQDPLIDNFSTTQDCASGEVIVFTPGSDDVQRIGYRLNNEQIEQWVDKKNADDEWIPITSNKPPGAVTITALKFVLEGSDDTSGVDYNQPRLSLYINGSVDAGLDEPTEFRIQGNVTQRILDY